MIVSACCIVMLLAIASQIKFILLVLIISIGSYAVLKHGLRLLPSACVALKIDINNQLKLIRWILASLAGILFILAYTPKHPLKELSMQWRNLLNRKRRVATSINKG